MPTLASYSVTFAEAVKRYDKMGQLLPIVELLNQTNDIVTDARWVECNEGTSNFGSVRTSLPSFTWANIGQAVATSKSTTAQVRETCGKLASWMEIPAETLKLQRNKEGFLAKEVAAFIESLRQEMASTMFYGNSGTAPEEFTGISTRYNSLSANNAQNIIDCGGTGSDNLSIWVLNWSDDTHMLHPTGTPAGLEVNDHGEETVDGASTPSGVAGAAGTRIRMNEIEFKWYAGLHLGDWRDACRICNIDVSNLYSESSAAWLAKFIIKGLKTVVKANPATTRLYMSRTAEAWLDIQRLNQITGGIGATPSAWAGTGFANVQDTDGKWVPSFRGFPIRTCDALLVNEARVT